MSDKLIYRFGPFEVDPQARQLRKHGVKLKLYGQSFQILLMLLDRPGEVVTREQMHKAIWPEGTFVDFEHSLNTAIKNLRRTLSDSAESPSFVETIPRLGYRFLARVEIERKDLRETVGEATVVVVPEASANEPVIAPTGEAASPRKGSRAIWGRWQTGLAAVGILAAALVVYVQWLRPHAQSQAQGGRIMMVVLPFENLTGDAGEDYFCDGFTEEMIAQLSPLDPGHIGVIALTSAMSYKSSHVMLDEIGRQLGVQYALEGTVRRDADDVRISAQLIRVEDQSPVWSRQYDRKLSGSLTLQAEIAQELADEIELTFEGDKTRVEARSKAPTSPNSQEAYDLYLRGRYFWNKRADADLRQAADDFQRAIAKDPNYARAYAGLADTYAMMCAWNQVPLKEFVPKARAAALKALQLDDRLAEAHTSLALIVENYDWDWQTAEKEYRRAIELDPGYATAHHWYAEYLTWEGRFDEAAAESERARQIDPLSLIILADRGAMLYYSRQYRQSIDQFRDVLQMDPRFARTPFIVYPYVKNGMYAEATSSVEAQSRIAGDAGWVLSMSAYVDADAGRREKARRTLARMEELRRHGDVDPQNFVLPYIGLGDKEKALDSLQQAYSRHSNIMTSIKVEPAFDPLRGEPQFQELLRRVGLAQ
jgi:TolB-like protein/DNA-binding winged helix-turn-helix (wHTH) protein/Tfp pilus assembly protein PilF